MGKKKTPTKNRSFPTGRAPALFRAFSWISMIYDWYTHKTHDNRVYIILFYYIKYDERRSVGK